MSQSPSVEPIQAAIRGALDYLVSADNQNPQDFEFKLWKATAEAEYAAFRLSMGYSLIDYPVKIKLQNPAESTEQDISDAKKLLDQSSSSLPTNPKKAYENLRTAIAHLRRAQTQLLGAKTRSSKKSS